MEFGKLLLDGLRQFSLGNLANQKNHFLQGLSPVVLADENISDAYQSWQDQVIKGPLKYGDMGKIMDNLFSTNQKHFQSVIKNVSNDDWKLKAELLTRHNDGVESVPTIGVSGEMQKHEKFNPFFTMGNDENTVGIKIKANDLVTIKAGVSEKLHSGRVCNNSWWSSVGFHHSAAVLDTRVELVNEELKLLKADVSGKFGHVIGKYGLLAGIDLACNNSKNFNWKEMCQSISLTFLYPNIFNRITVKPYGDFMIRNEFYLRVNDKLEIACSASSGWNSPYEWNGKNHDLGVKYTYSEDLAYGIKSDLEGNVIAGAWTSTQSVKFGLTAMCRVLRDIQIPVFGISLEF